MEQPDFLIPEDQAEAIVENETLPTRFYYVSKLYDIGLSCAFRQPFAESHCHFVHGYDLKFEVMFQGTELDANNWLIDFGGLKDIKRYLEYMFDHTTVIAKDDPELETFRDLNHRGVIDARFVPRVGIESFARMVYERVDKWLRDNLYYPAVSVKYVRCWERDANSAAYGNL